MDKVCLDKWLRSFGYSSFGIEDAWHIVNILASHSIKVELSIGGDVSIGIDP